MANSLGAVKAALFGSEFKIMGYKVEDGIHTFVFQTETIAVDQLASDVEVNGMRLKCFIGAGKHRYKPFQENEEFTELVVISSPPPYEPYTFAVKMRESSPHFREFMDYWNKNAPK